MEAWIGVISFCVIIIAACVWKIWGKRREVPVFCDGADTLRFGLIIAHPDDEVRCWGLELFMILGEHH